MEFYLPLLRVSPYGQLGNGRFQTKDGISVKTDGTVRIFDGIIRLIIRLLRRILRTNYTSETDNPSSMKFRFHTRTDNSSNELSFQTDDPSFA